jgi:gamma-glutamylcyclotransferase
VGRVERVWYFANGSNMQAATFAGRRGITPTATRAVRVPGWRLVLDKPPLFGPGPAFANIVAEDGAQVFGVVYEIGVDDLEHVELTEGVTLGNYRRAEVTAIPLEAPCTAFTLVTEKRDDTLLPSAHYMGLLIEGAEAHGLPAAWMAFLRSHPTAADTPESVARRARMDGLLAQLRR